MITDQELVILDMSQKKLDIAAGKRNTPPKCSLDVPGGLIFLLDPKT
jgi:hypothetical protein